MEPTACGIGGDLFAIVWDAKSEQALRPQRVGPRAARADRGQGPAETRTARSRSTRRYAWTVPGCVDGWFELHATLRQAADGGAPGAGDPRCRARASPCSQVIAGAWKRARDALQGQAGLRRDVPARRAAPAARARSSATRRSPAPTSARRGRARRLLRGADRRRDRRLLAEATAASSRPRTSPRTAPTGSSPISTDLPRRRRVGAAAATARASPRSQMLNMLESFDLKAMGRDSADFWHVMVEAKKLAFEDRARYYADPGLRQDAGRRAALEGLRARARRS